MVLQAHAIPHQLRHLCFQSTTVAWACEAKTTRKTAPKNFFNDQLQRIVMGALSSKDSREGWKAGADVKTTNA